MNPKKPVTIRQVARAAGVSAQTISRVVNDHPDVSPETRHRVQGVIKRLGYRPNAIARSLIRSRSHTIGVVIAGIDYYGPTRTLIGIEKEIRVIGYSLLLDLLNHPEAENVEPILNRLLSQRVDGIIWAVSEIGSNHKWLEDRAPNLPVPVIYLTMQARPGLSVVSIDNQGGGCQATEHLLDQGYKQIGLISGPMASWETRERVSGWQDALAKAGMPCDVKRQVVEGDWSASSGEEGIRRLLEQFPEMDAVFACNDQMALGVLQYAYRLGRRVPEDLAVVGFDDIPEAAYFTPPLTTIRHQLIDLGCTAVRELKKMIDSAEQEGAETPPKSIILEPELVVRESTVVRPA
jgi:LacI family transcriptional regulator